MPIKKEWGYGVNLHDIAVADAKKILARRDQQRREEANLPHEWETHDTIWVMESKLDDQPTLRWEVIAWPFSIESDRGIQASLADAIRNKLSLRQMLEKRLRRLYRELLVEAQVMPEDQALKRVMRLEVAVTDAPRIILPH